MTTFQSLWHALAMIFACVLRRLQTILRRFCHSCVQSIDQSKRTRKQPCSALQRTPSCVNTLALESPSPLSRFSVVKWGLTRWVEILEILLTCKFSEFFADLLQIPTQSGGDDAQIQDALLHPIALFFRTSAYWCVSSGCNVYPMRNTSEWLEPSQMHLQVRFQTKYATSARCRWRRAVRTPSCQPRCVPDSQVSRSG